ncbi:MAG TPA: S1C family serine protease [Flavobacteriales bacterium]|nr:S1C family serine protease [Flavobacteriales bacterium]
MKKTSHWFATTIFTLLCGFSFAQKKLVIGSTNEKDSVFVFSVKDKKKFIGIGSGTYATFEKVVPVLITGKGVKDKRFLAQTIRDPKKTNFAASPVNVPVKPKEITEFDDVSFAFNKERVEMSVRQYFDLKSMLTGAKQNSYSRTEEIKTSGKGTESLDEMTKLLIEDLFSAELYDYFVPTGYVDTNHYFVRKGASCLQVEAELTHIHYEYFGSSAKRDPEQVRMALRIKWNVKDSYDNKIFEIYTVDTSDYHSAIEFNDQDLLFKNLWKDALALGTYSFLINKEFYTKADEFKKAEEAYYSALAPMVFPKVDDTLRQLRNFDESVVTIKGSKGHGTGFIVSKSGYLVTNYHVVAQNDSLTAIFNNGDKLDVTIERYSKDYDLALLKLDSNNFVLRPVSILARDDFKAGENVYAMGTPYDVRLDHTLTNGIISAYRTWDNVKVIQTDVGINPGNSGGPLLNDKGRVLGIVSAKLMGYTVEGIGFAIPALYLQEALKIDFKN